MNSGLKFNPWGLGPTAIPVLVIYVIVLVALTASEKPMWVRDSFWALIPIGGILSAVALLKESGPKGIVKTALFGLHLANLAFAIVMLVILIVTLPGIIKATGR